MWDVSVHRHAMAGCSVLFRDNQLQQGGLDTNPGQVQGFVHCLVTSEQQQFLILFTSITALCIRKSRAKHPARLVHAQ
jgi:hypothetical protein